MSWKLFCARVGLTGAALVTLLAAPSYGGLLTDQHEAQVEGAPAAEQTAPAGDPLQTESSATEGTQEGITVHGEWTIQVFEPDGTPVDRREFRNALTGGARDLARLLTRQASPGLWTIALANSSSFTSGPCLRSDGVAIACFISEPPLVPQLQEPVGQPPRVLLFARKTAEVAGTVGFVDTRLLLCTATASPSSACSGVSASSGIFTASTLPASITVSAGQIIEVSVTISFS